ncbi:MAG: hypothetical protein MN733_27515 [Nitrososphaera sp.]|nr:hypothetical protein [Nitrososphaera sp.]
MIRSAKPARVTITSRITEDDSGYSVITARSIYGWITGETDTFYRFKEHLESPAYEWLPKKCKYHTWKMCPGHNRYSLEMTLRAADAKELAKELAKIVKGWGTL